MTSKNSKDAKCSAHLGWAFLITIISLLSISMLITFLFPSPTSSNPNFAKRIDPKTPFVEDNARVLTAKTRRRIADLNQRAVVAPGQPQLLVVTVDSLKGVSISDLADKKKVGSMVLVQKTPILDWSMLFLSKTVKII